MTTKDIEKDLRAVATEQRAKVNAWFFKTGEGQYGEGDVFLGVTVPATRNIVKKYKDQVTLDDLVLLLQNKYHEVRLFACICFVELMKKAEKTKNEKLQKKIFDTYLKNTNRINNWDLVDLSCRDVVGFFTSLNADPQ